MSPTYYYGLWIVYTLGSLVAYRILWDFTRWPKVWWLGSFVRIMAVVVIVTPAAQAEGSAYLAPAWITMAFDELQRLGDGWLRAGVNLMAASAIGFLVYFVHIIYSLIQRGRKKERT
jgi:hypothetical protein